MTERLLIVRVGHWPNTRRVWPLHSDVHAGRLNGRKSAGAVFAREGEGAWRCVRAVPGLLSWLELSIEDIQVVIHEHALRYEWARVFEV